MKDVLILGSVLTLFISCKKIEVKDPVSPSTPGVSSYHAYVTNEGNFQSSNAGITRYDPVDGDIEKSYYAISNNNMQLGDVCQSMTVHNDEVYIVLNNSSRIEIVSKKDFKRKGSITGFTSPRYMSISGNKGFVSDLFGDKISVVDLTSCTITRTIPLKGWTEEMLIAGSTLWVTNLRSEYVYKIDVNSETVTDSIHTGFAPASIKRDHNGKIWVLCQGDPFTSIPAELVRIDSETGTAAHFPVKAGSTKLRLNAEGTILFYIADGIYKIPVDNTVIPSSPWIAKDNRNIYGLGIDPMTGDIYLSDAHDFVSEGTIYHYTKENSLVRTFKAGINPNDFYFF